MSQWENIKPGYKSKTVQGEGFTVIIHRPELPPEVYSHREKEVERALASMKGGAAV